MTYGEWNNSGETTYYNSQILYADDLNLTMSVGIPIGGIVGWVDNLGELGSINLPDNWQLCDGTTISDSDSPLNGETVPDLNAENKYLRGNTTSTGSGGTTSHGHTTDTYGASSRSRSPFEYTASDTHYHLLASSSHLPRYYQVKFIMRIK